MTLKPRVTIAIPTFNRSELLRTSLNSVLVQDYPDFQIVVLDNASSSETEAVVQSFDDSRITYVRHKTNIGLFRNWKLAIELNLSPYLCILPDDDVMLPGFIHESVLALDTHLHTAFSVVQVKGVDIYGMPVQLPEDPLPEGLISGLKYLHEIVAGRNWVIAPASVMMRASALESVGSFDTPHSNRSIDFNLYLRLASQYDIIFIPKELCQCLIHPEQTSQLSNTTGPLSTMAERTDAISYLLKSARAEDALYREWLAERLIHISGQRSEFTAQLLPNFNLNWSERLEIVTQEIVKLIPDGKRFILVDESLFGIESFTDNPPLPFLEGNGLYLGPPPDDDTAISELDRMRQTGAMFIVFGWPAFWWLDYYAGLRDHLYSKFRCILKNSRLIAFDLHQELEDTAVFSSMALT